MDYTSEKLGCNFNVRKLFIVLSIKQNETYKLSLETILKEECRQNPSDICSERLADIIKQEDYTIDR